MLQLLVIIELILNSDSQHNKNESDIKMQGCS